jgi:putative FmdB family regulatory protein
VPTYDYVCEACGHEFEHFQSMSDPVLKKCPKCGKRRLVRRIGAGAGLIFKGSGFYVTDYKSAARSAGEQAEADAGKGTDAKGDGAGSEGTKGETKKDASSKDSSAPSKKDAGGGAAGDASSPRKASGGKPGSAKKRAADGK